MWFYIILIIIILILGYFYVNHNIYQSVGKINRIFSKYCNEPAVLNPKEYQWSANFRQYWYDILTEYQNYSNKFKIPKHSEINKFVSACDPQNNWQTLYLRAFNKNTSIANYFPKTMNLINKCPCTLAFFSVIGPHTKLKPHIGIYKGVLRYHLGLIIPKKWNQCFIKVDGQTLYWHEGDDIMFDDMFLHHVENNTDEPRIILFLDIKRDFNNPFLNLINNFLLQFVKSNDVLKETIKNVDNYNFSQ